jgi:DNA invertase Pin-like site-specific DNA recombinase
MDKTRVALYIRVSTDEQAREGVSLAEQRERLELWAKLEGWEVTGHYSDEGVSGATDNRLELQRLMYDAKTGRFDLVAVAKLDRFFRNTRLLLNYIYELDEYGVSFAAQAEGIDTRKSGIGKVILALLGAVAEWERDRIGERIKDFRSHLASKGRWSSGRTPFGYRFNKDTKELDIYEPEAEVVRHIFNTYVNYSLGTFRVAERLNKEQKLTPRWGRRKHNFWTQSAIRYVLTHPAYKGGQSEDWQFKCPPIVEPTLWYLAQRRLATNRHFKPTKRGKLDFQGLLRCGLCGHTLRIGCDRNQAMKYECPGRLKRLHLDGSPRCTLPRYSVNLLEAALMAEIDNTFSDPERVAKCLKTTLDNLQAERQELQRRLNPLQSEVDQVHKRMEIADAKLEAGRLDPITYKATIKGLTGRLRDIERRQREQDPGSIAQLASLNEEVAYLRSILKKGIKGYAEEVAREFTSDNVAYETLKRGIPRTLALVNQHPRDLIGRYGMVAFVHPDRVELKASLPIQLTDMSNVSPDYMSGRYPQSR